MLIIAEITEAICAVTLFFGRDRKKMEEQGAINRKDTVQAAGMRPERPMSDSIPRGTERKLVATIIPRMKMRGRVRSFRLPMTLVRVKVAPARDMPPRITGKTTMSVVRA